MTSVSSQAIKTLGVFKKPSIFDKGIGAALPEAYKKFYKEWKLTEPTAVHYIPEEGKWKKDPLTGEVHPIQNIPIPLAYPKEHHQHLWGGEAVVQGFRIKDKYSRRVPHFWVPVLKRSVIYSEVLDRYFSVVVTDRALNLIHTHYGLDHYLLKTPACDLKSLLPLTLKRAILQELQGGCQCYADRPEKQQEILKTYKQYLAAYTPEEIDWYGYSFRAACKKFQAEANAKEQVVPFKQVYRTQLIEKLKAAGIKEASSDSGITIGESTSWLQRINPFGKKHET